MKTIHIMDWNIPVPHPHTFYIVNINTFTHERELQLKPCCRPDISDIRVCRPCAGKQPGYSTEDMVIIPCQKREFGDVLHDPV